MNELTAYSSEDFGWPPATSSRENDASPLSKNVDILAFWRMNKDRLPLLSVVAGKFLSVSATSVPSERVFSATAWLHR